MAGKASGWDDVDRLQSMEVIKGTKRHLQVAMTPLPRKATPHSQSSEICIYKQCCMRSAGLKLPLLDRQILLNFYPVERPLQIIQVTKVSTVK